MIYDRPESELKQLIEPWTLDFDQGRVRGFGYSGMFLANREAGGPEGRIREVFDNNPELWHRDFGPVRVRPPEEISSRPGRIVVFTNRYFQVKAQLESLGLAEFRDFMVSGHFVPLYHYFKEGRIRLEHVVLPVTTKCSLRCVDCGMMVTHIRRPRHLPWAGLAADLDRLLERVDQIQTLCLYGGEPLMHPELHRLVDHLRERYRDRLGHLLIITNGTVEPREELLEALEKFGRVFFRFSNYGQNLAPDYGPRLAGIQEKIARRGFECRQYVWPAWSRLFTEPGQGPLYAEDGELRAHYQRCMGHGACIQTALADGRLLTCLEPWVAELSGQGQMGPGEYLDLKAPGQGESGRFDLLRTALGWCGRGHLEFCNFCFGSDPRLSHLAVDLPVARQA